MGPVVGLISGRGRDENRFPPLLGRETLGPETRTLTLGHRKISIHIDLPVTPHEGEYPQLAVGLFVSVKASEIPEQ